MAAPTDQRAGVRPISFLLEDGGIFGPSVPPVTLKIRPEDLTRNEPSRVTVHQTLGRETSGWVDNFGEGLPSVTISGHTGWRADSVSGEDGVQAFENLHNTVVPRYHAAKQQAINSGQDPASVRLLFIDTLDNFAWNVAPMQFSLRRNKSRPLLMQYNIVLQAISTSVDNPIRLPFPTSSIPAGLDSLIASINAITGYINGVSSFIDRVLVVPVRDFMQKTSRLYSSVVTAIRSGAGIADQLIGVARMITQSGMNIFRTMAAVADIPSITKAKLMQVVSEYSNIFCLLNNAFKQRSSYQDYSPFYGSSNCSSTTGGRPISPLSGSNPFYSLYPTQPGLGVALTPSAQSAVAYSASSDVVLNPMPQPVVADTIRTISSGMAVA
jgi:hypothetical protein